MTYKRMIPFLLPAIAAAMLFFHACKEDSNTGSTGQLNLEITDGPIDDASVKGVFITVAEVKVDGQTFYGFLGKKTINLLDYQQGNVAALGLGNLDAGGYQQITLVLDHQTDATGSGPGCYVLTDDNVKHALSTAATQTIEISKNFSIEAGQKTELVIDVDLRKAVQYQNGSTDKYDFVAAADLLAAIRLVVKDEAGSIAGACQNDIVIADKIIVYAYKKGDFNRAVEIESQNGVAFKNAVTSAVVGNDGQFTLSFLEEGDYELHFAAYKDTDSDGRLEMLGTLLLNSLINLESIRLEANADVQLEILVTGILP